MYDFLHAKSTYCQNDHGFEIFSIDKQELRSLASDLKKNGFCLLLDIAGVDNLADVAQKRFCLIYTFRDYKTNKLLALRIDLEEDESVESLSDIYKSANWAEREAYDQFGIVFLNHPNLKRILNHKEFKGHPLRKDYPIDGYQMLYSSDSLIEEMQAELVRNGYEEDENEDFNTKFIFLNMGPSHPATHGTIRNLVALDGEQIISCVTEIGYLHRGFEKSCENHTYNQIIPYTDRLNYCSVMLNNIAFAKTVEEMLDVDLPDRAIFMRIILGELSRIMDHLVCIAAIFVDIGGLTGYWYLFSARERLYTFFSKLTGARFTNSFARIGGMANDFHDGWEDEINWNLSNIEKAISDALSLIGTNKIFLDRTQNICPITQKDALSFGLTGVNLRSTGIDYDVRKDNPYYYYDSFDFSVPIGSVGDVYERIMLRFFEMKESISIIRQAMQKIPQGKVSVENKRIFLPAKQDVYGNIEGLMNHFKLVFEGVKVPKAMHYSAIEGANGELGFLIASDGSGTPKRVKVRPPCFYALNSYADVVRGVNVADAVLNLGSLNIIAGELDR